jgi:alpha-L-fucosidase
VEADTPLHKNHWFWHPNDEGSLKSTADLISTYEQTVGRGGQLVLGIAPDRRGLLPDADVQRLREFGDALHRRFGNNLVPRHAPDTLELERALDGDPDTFWTAPAGANHATIEVVFDRPIVFDRALTMEWLNAGQHIEEYAVEIYRQGKWMAVAEGHAIGHKKIDAFARATASRVRLNVIAASGQIAVREFRLYDTESR